MTNSSLAVLVNREGGAAAKAGPALKDEIVAAFAAAGTTAQVEMLAGKDIAEAIERAAKAHARICVAGGDGTVAGAAQILTGTDTELALLPLGTLNHLARDLGIPSELNEAAALAAHGEARAIDVGNVNGQRFVNNASIGLYPHMVEDRDAFRERHGWPKWLAMVPAAWNALAGMRQHRLRIDLGNGEKALVTPLLFVGNDAYSLDAGAVGTRAALDDGKLSVYAVACRSRSGLVWFGIRAIAGKADRNADFEALGETAEMTVKAQGGAIQIALDGEVRELATPLAFKSEAGALRIVAPS